MTAARKVQDLPQVHAAPDWPAALARALRGEGVEVHYQPIVDLKRATVVGHEALLRFTGHAITSPATWLEAAHALGCGADLEAMALRLAFADRAHLPPDTFLSVNVLPSILASPQIQAVFDEQGPLDGVVVELTEHSRVEQYESLRPQLDALRSDGAVIAVDDAGAGYAGLQHLVGIKPDLIKLDRALIAGIGADRPRRALVDMIGTFASRFDAWILAEGVETPEELAALTRLGVPLAQGYLLARPGPRWQEIDRDASARLRACRQRPAGSSLHLLLEEVPLLRATPESLAQTDPGRGPTVLVDEEHRPLAAIAAADWAAARDAVLRVHVDSDIAETVLRAMARAPQYRFQPLLCTDDDGRFVGLVRIERAVEYLAAAGIPPGDVDG